MEHVYPKLDKLCKKHGFDFQVNNKMFFLLINDILLVNYFIVVYSLYYMVTG